MAQAGYEDDDDSSANTKLYGSILDVIEPRAVTAPLATGARERLAIERNMLVQDVFKDTPGPGVCAYTNSELVQHVWKSLLNKVWNAVKSAPNGPVQKLVASRMPGYVLVRLDAIVLDGRKDEVGAVYVTNVFKLIEQDLQRPLEAAHASSGETLVDTMDMVGIRQPDNRPALLSSVRTALALTADENSKRAQRLLGTGGDSE